MSLTSAQPASVVPTGSWPSLLRQLPTRTLTVLDLDTNMVDDPWSVGVLGVTLGEVQQNRPVRYIDCSFARTRVNAVRQSFPTPLVTATTIFELDCCDPAPRAPLDLHTIMRRVKDGDSSDTAARNGPNLVDDLVSVVQRWERPSGSDAGHRRDRLCHLNHLSPWQRNEAALIFDDVDALLLHDPHPLQTKLQRLQTIAANRDAPTIAVASAPTILRACLRAGLTALHLNLEEYVGMEDHGWTEAVVATAIHDRVSPAMSSLWVGSAIAIEYRAGYEQYFTGQPPFPAWPPLTAREANH